MAEYLLRNSLNPNKVVSCTITFRQLAEKNEDGELVWVVELNTVEPHKNGGSIPAEYVHYTSDANLDVAIKEATERIAAKIEWEPTLDDLRPPFVADSFPMDGEQLFPIDSTLVIDIQDVLPSAGIDVDSIQISVNGIDVTNELDIKGDPFNYKVSWRPSIIVYDTE